MSMSDYPGAEMQMRSEDNQIASFCCPGLG